MSFEAQLFTNAISLNSNCKQRLEQDPFIVVTVCDVDAAQFDNQLVFVVKHPPQLFDFRTFKYIWKHRSQVTQHTF